MTGVLVDIPADAGIRESLLRSAPLWLSAAAGMTGGLYSTEHEHD